MRSIATFIKLLVVVISFGGVPAQAQAQAQTPEAIRAKKQAARRYAGGKVSLPVAAFASGLRVCARETPSGIAGYWRVPPKIVDAMDAALMVHLRKSGIEQGLPFASKLYVRQYAGFVRDGIRMVYINALLVEKGSPLAAQVQKAFPASCQGISGSWGIQYDTKAKKFAGFTGK